LIIDVETTVVALELQHAGIKVDGLYGFKNDGKVVGPSDSNSGKYA
jgi:hypothetical protein